jgi:hypothetical protein
VDAAGGGVMAALLAYRLGGAFAVAAACALGGSAIGLAAADGSGGWDELGAGIQGLVAGTFVGALGGVGFAFLPPPRQARARWLVLGGLVAVAAVALLVLERLD